MSKLDALIKYLAIFAAPNTQGDMLRDVATTLNAKPTGCGRLEQLMAELTTEANAQPLSVMHLEQ